MRIKRNLLQLFLIFSFCLFQGCSKDTGTAEVIELSYATNFLQPIFRASWLKPGAERLKNVLMVN